MMKFDSTKTPLRDLLQDIRKGTIQLPDFQRGWVWDDDHIRDLLVSLARSFPIGAVMLLETGGEVRFQTRPVEGIDPADLQEKDPESLILDGQQRLTTLTQAIGLTTPVDTRTAKGKRIRRHYYFDIRQALEAPESLDEAVVAVDEHRQLRSHFGQLIDLDLSTTELECRHLHFPCDQIMRSDDWEQALYKHAPDDFPLFMQFRSQVLDAFRNYALPVIQLGKETTKEAVCLVFEKVNTGGVQLSVFELITASYAADGYNLRDDWYGSTIRGVESRKERLETKPVLEGTQATEFLQGISLLHCQAGRSADVVAGITPRAINAKRAAVLQLPLSAWRSASDPLEQGFLATASFLTDEGFYRRREVPYSTQLVPLAAVLSHLGHRWMEPRIREKLRRWFWCGVLGELYGGAVETRMANDFEDLLRWFDDEEAIPRTIRDASFQPERLDTLRTRNSAAYKGIHILAIRDGARDWFWTRSIRDLDTDDIGLDIHHIFPRRWCESRGISAERYDSILNKTSISYKANRMIGGDAPSVYLPRLQNHDHVGHDDATMDGLIRTHALTPALLRSDAFDEFLEDRRTHLCRLIGQAMGKPVAVGAATGEGGDH